MPRRSAGTSAASRRPRAGRHAGRASPPDHGRRRRTGSSARRARRTRAGTRAVADELRVGGDRRLEIGEQLGPDRDDGVIAASPWNSSRGGSASRRTTGFTVHDSAPNAEEARARAGVARARCPPARPRTAACRRRSRSSASRTYWPSPHVSPLRHSSCRLRLQKTIRPSSRSWRATRRSSTPSSAPRRLGVLDDRGTRPSALNGPCPSCIGGDAVGIPQFGGPNRDSADRVQCSLRSMP